MTPKFTGPNATFRADLSSSSSMADGQRGEASGSAGAPSSTYYSSESSRAPSPNDEKRRFLHAWQQNESQHHVRTDNSSNSSIEEEGGPDGNYDEEGDEQEEEQGGDYAGDAEKASAAGGEDGIRPRHRRQSHRRKASHLHQSFSRLVIAPLQRTLATRRGISASIVSIPQRRLRLLFKGLAACIVLLVLSVILPVGSPLSIRGHRGERFKNAKQPIPAVDWSNQKLASGKGWGWRIADKFKGVTDAPTAQPAEQSAKAIHDYNYGQTGGDDNATATILPDIPCQLDTAAFASHYKLTPKFKYSRRYVTAKPQAPALDKPSDYDPVPRKLSDAIIQGWQTMSWRGLPLEEVCGDLKGKQLEKCLTREQKMRDRRGAAEAQVQQRRSVPSSLSSPAEAVARTLSDEQKGGLVTLSSCTSSREPLELPTYPVPRTLTQPHHIILGLASEARRMFDLMPVLAYSFAHSNLHLVLNLPRDRRIPELRRALRARGIRATIILSPEEDYLRRWVELPSLLLDHADPGLTRWAMVADDDTFFLSMPKLFQMLDKYDYKEERYIGALTDDWRQADSGMIGFGGAGVILSMTLLDSLRPHWPECKQLQKPADYRLAHCIYSHTHTRLTIEWGLHQTDMWDDIRGMLESGRDIITWHHWKSWSTGMDPILIARAGAACGSECLLQRFLSHGVARNSSAFGPATTDEEAFLFVHGLSLTLHPKPLPDFARTEATWKVWSNSDFSQSVGPTRPRIREGRPILSRLTSAAAAADAAAAQSGVDSTHLAKRRAAPVPRSSPGRWKETWLLEDVRLDEGSMGPANSWDNDGRGIREIYIKRASRAKGYINAGLFDSGGGEVAADSLAADADGALDEAEGDEEDEERAHRELEESIKGLLSKVLGQGYDSKTQDRIVAEQLAEEEQDSVVELIWV